jgi:hypothetical protein
MERPRSPAPTDWLALAPTCSSCGTRFDEPAWSELPLVERIEPRKVRLGLRDWPLDLCIEVRACRRCGREIARGSRSDP